MVDNVTQSAQPSTSGYTLPGTYPSEPVTDWVIPLDAVYVLSVISVLF